MIAARLSVLVRRPGEVVRLSDSYVGSQYPDRPRRRQTYNTIAVYCGVTAGRA